jgi:hypothetical protein
MTAVLFLIECFSGDQSKEGEIVWSVRYFFGTRKMQNQLWWNNLKETGNLEDLGINGRLIFKCVLKFEDMD